VSIFAPGNLLWVVIFLVPGFVANRIYSLRCSSGKPDLEKMVVEFLTYSLFNLILWAGVIIPIAKTPPDEWHAWYVSIIGLLFCFLSPAALALIWAWLRMNWLHKHLGMDHPTAKGWDYFLTSHSTFWVLFHLKNGKMMGGFFGGKSYASTYPQDPELYIEEVWRVDEIGRFIEIVPGTSGAVVRHTDWDMVEFFEVKLEVNNGIEQGTAEGGQRELPSSSGGAEGTNGQQFCGSGSTDSPAGRVGDCAAARRSSSPEEVIAGTAV
jgi:hypothetical protein